MSIDEWFFVQQPSGQCRCRVGTLFRCSQGVNPGHNLLFCCRHRICRGVQGSPSIIGTTTPVRSWGSSKMQLMYVLGYRRSCVTEAFPKFSFIQTIREMRAIQLQKLHPFRGFYLSNGSQCYPHSSWFKCGVCCGTRLCCCSFPRLYLDPAHWSRYRLDNHSKILLILQR